MQVVDPTINTLTVRWDPAVGNVRSYKVLYTAEPGGEERMVRTVSFNHDAPGLFVEFHTDLEVTLRFLHAVSSL